MIKLHLGCGKRNFGHGWDHIDVAEFPHIKSHDIERLPYKNKSVSLIYASHLLSYISEFSLPIVLTEWNRVLQDGGILRVSVPDFRVLSSLYTEYDHPLEDIKGPILGEMSANCEMIYHKTLFDKRTLSKWLFNYGFDFIEEWDYKQVDHGTVDDHSQAYIPQGNRTSGKLISINLQGYKRP